MKNVPPPIKVPQLSDDATVGRVRPVSAVGAEPDTSSQSVLVQLRVPDSDMDFAFALSPPAAALLMWKLRQAKRDFQTTRGQQLHPGTSRLIRKPRCPRGALFLVPCLPSAHLRCYILYMGTNFRKSMRVYKSLLLLPSCFGCGRDHHHGLGQHGFVALAQVQPCLHAGRCEVRQAFPGAPGKGQYRLSRG